MVIVAALTTLFVWQGGNASEESTPPAPPSASSTLTQHQQESDILDLSAPPSVSSTLARPIGLLEVQRALGPWVPVDPLRPTGQKIMLSRANGTLEEGSRVIVRDETWNKVESPPAFTYDVRDGYARLSIDDWFAQEVNFEQAFILEANPAATYIVAADGTLYRRKTSAILSP